MDLPGRKVSMPVFKSTQSKCIMLGAYLCIFTSPLLVLTFTKVGLTADGLQSWAEICIPLFAVCVLVTWSGVLGVFTEASIVEEGLWVSDGSVKSLIPWNDITELEAAIPPFGKGWPALLITAKNQKKVFRLFLKVEKGVAWPLNPREFPDIVAIAERATSAALNFDTAAGSKPPGQSENHVTSSIQSRMRGWRFGIPVILIVFGIFGKIVFGLGNRGRGQSQKNFDISECKFYSKSELSLLPMQKYMRRAKFIFHSKETVEAYRQAACRRAGLDLAPPGTDE
jgi:hypothetical protein